MERRADERTRLAQEVLLCSPGFGLVKAVTRDISDSGTFVATKHLALAENDRIDVCFLSHTPEKTLHKVSAEVTRVNQQGYGLRFVKKISKAMYDVAH
ncbi:MAG: PilZ domain-containing protein [Gammaproteobacteria bacterium]|nr:PilZ domain-containing protein [Gammaproteobacteria bacterium]